MHGPVQRARLLFLILLTLITSTSLATAGRVVRVADVVDGDTIVLDDGRKVRYLGINTPERGEPLYQKAKDLNSSLVMGKTVRLELEKGRDIDAYGRLLAYVFVGKQMVNAQLVGEGMAHALFIGPKGKHHELLLKQQSRARQRGLGMWSGSDGPRTLKITSVHPAEPSAPPGRGASYVRIANIGEKPAQLSGHILSDDKGHRFVFPEIRMEPGYSVIVSGRRGNDTKYEQEQAVVYWLEQDSIWRPEGGTAHLADTTGKTVDTFPYQGSHMASSTHGQSAQSQKKVIGNRSSMIYHLPGQPNYDRVKKKNRVYFNTEEEAVRAGYRRAKR